MKKIKKELSKFALTLPNILVPNNSVDKTKWAVIACDQYSSQPDYWQKVSSYVGDSPSTLHIIYPECYLNETNEEAIIKNINSKMESYLADSIFCEQKEAFIFVRRKLKNQKIRSGLICAIDLEAYDFNKGSTSLIRATEGTIIERIPPRLKIRKDAPLELPHILVLIDDKEAPIINLFDQYVSKKEPLYSTQLMEDSGEITGYLINQKEVLADFIKALKVIANKKSFKKRYDSKELLLYAIGDGNHSLATAKSNWEQIKKTLSKKEMETHPARYALVEINSIYDTGIEFEPIHRVLFESDYKKFLSDLQANFEIQVSHFDKNKVEEFALSLVDEQQFLLIQEDQVSHIQIKNPNSSLTVGTIQQFLDNWLKTNSGKIDFIHGVKACFELSNNKNNFAILLPNISKSDFFKTVIKDGSFPRKTFSMGEAHEKRFYYEARKIR